MGIQRIAVLTSGGDAPGMNAAVRAVARVGLGLGLEVFGVQHGYKGLIRGDLVPLDSRAVGGILARGGTMLGTARAPEFRTDAGQTQALEQLAARDIGGLVVIGGNGSQSGALTLCERGFPVVGVASTIDNDLAGVDITIGVDTALGVIVEAIDRLRDTASSHHRAFVVETMGRGSGYLALRAAVATGAELAIIPEVPVTAAEILSALRAAYARGKSHFIIVLAEQAGWTAQGLCDAFTAAGSTFEPRPVVLGHVQRGGPPSVFDRLLGTQLGAAAAQALAAGETGFVVGLAHGEVVRVPFAQAVAGGNKIDPAFYHLATTLAH
ncbi:MAG TPA: ATP-dependent 6-phosphofructokinase [Chloroflexota bacterium]|nr:ATP-dependent 6-phosphofructokinase [Chloroflexota bacterium]